VNEQREIEEFIQSIRDKGLLSTRSPVVVSRAPGRLDVMGGIADYSGSLVLQKTIREATCVAIQRTNEPAIQTTSLSDDAGSRLRSLSWPAELLYEGTAPITYERAAALLRDADQHWASYVIGVILVLVREQNLRLDRGLKIVIGSKVPEGKGVASSAALEVAVMQAVASLCELQLEPPEAAALCQKAENLVAGAPCGIMDQMTSMCGEKDALLAMVCQPATLLPSLPIPSEIDFWGIDSGERHAVSGSDYGSVRTGAFMGLRILSENRNNFGNGFLANISPGVFEKELLRVLPEEMSGREFLSRYSRTADSVTAVDPNCIYKIRQPTSHPIYENARVHQFREAVMQQPDGIDWSELGALMYQSHESYSSCGLGSKGTDLIVNLVREAGLSNGLYGARITGGGSGGTVAILASAGSVDAISRIATNYEELSGHRPHVFSGSSAGAASFRTVNLIA